MEDKESLAERLENELEALEAIYMDDFQDIREKVSWNILYLFAREFRLSYLHVINKTILLSQSLWFFVRFSLTLKFFFPHTTYSLMTFQR